MAFHRNKFLCQLLGLIFLGFTSFAVGDQDWYLHRDLESKSDASRLVSFQVPITVYDELHNNFKVLSNGVISFQNKLQIHKRKFSLKKKKLIAPFLLTSHRHKHFQKYNVDIYNGGKVLQRATTEIQKFFHAHRDFEAEQVIVITWSHRQHLLHQTIIITNGKQTFLQLIYGKNEKAARKKAHAGISYGDGVRYTYFIDNKSRKVRNLFQNSNVNKPGRWVFMIGSSEGTVFQVHPANTSPFVDNRSKFMIKNDLGCYTMETKSPFRVFEKTSSDSCTDFCRSMHEPYAMFFKERSCSCLSALYNILKKVSDKDCTGSNRYTVFSTRQFLSDPQAVSDIDECTTDPNACSPHATCSNTEYGYNCKCKSDYFGNGKVCISKASPARILGKFTGTVNGEVLQDADLSGIIELRNGVSYLTISTIAEDIGFPMQLASSITDIIGWVFAAKIKNSMQNGMDIAGERFTSKTVIEFDTGEIFTATHRMKGRDDFNYFVMDTEVSGRLPKIQPFSKLTLSSYIVQLQKVEDGTLEGKATVSYSLQDRSYSYIMTMMINYDDQNEKNLQQRQSFTVGKRTAFYDSRQMLLRYLQTNTIESFQVFRGRQKPAIPLLLRIGTSSQIQSTETPQTTTTTPPIEKITSPMTQTTEQPSSPSTSSSSTVKTTTTMEPSSTVKTTTTMEPSSTVKTTTTMEPSSTVASTTLAPTTIALCNGQQCDPNARCSVFSNAFQCICKEDYIGNGTHCQRDTRLKCGPNRCSLHAECIQENGRLFCICKGGYVGDGVQCENEKECNCHPDATCFNNGQGLKYCLCDKGFQGDGKICEDINECEGNSLVCGPYSKCVNTRGSFMCKCDQGYRKNGTLCEDIPECKEQSYVCDSSAECIEIPGSYKCICPEGYRFKLDGRSCVVKCPRCLNGGTCIPPNSCNCRRGFTGSRCQWAGNEFLVLGKGGTIKRLSIPTSKTGFGSLHEKRGHVFVAVDYDCEEKMVYWTDLLSGTINRISYNGSKHQIIVKGLLDPQGITIDWLGRNIFWTDTGYDRIGVSRLNGNYRKDALISGDLKNPRAIVCDPYGGKLYWTDWNRNRPRIEVASMDGSLRRVFVSKELLLPNGLTIDYRTEKLCWTDAWYSTISCIGFDGRNRNILVSEAKYPFSLAMHGSVIYWTEWKTGQIGRYHRDKEISLPPIKGGVGSDGRLYDIKVVTPCPEKKNVCSKNNGGCRYLCLMKSFDVKSCKCPDGPSILFPPGACHNNS